MTTPTLDLRWVDNYRDVYDAGRSALWGMPVYMRVLVAKR